MGVIHSVKTHKGYRNRGMLVLSLIAPLRTIMIARSEPLGLSFAFITNSAVLMYL